MKKSLAYRMLLWVIYGYISFMSVGQVDKALRGVCWNLYVTYRKWILFRNLILDISDKKKPASKNHFYPADLQVVCTCNCQCYLIIFHRLIPFYKGLKICLPHNLTPACMKIQLLNSRFLLLQTKFEGRSDLLCWTSWTVQRQRGNVWSGYSHKCWKY